MALIPQMTVPTGNDAFTADAVLPGLNWIYGWELNSCLLTAGSTIESSSKVLSSHNATEGPIAILLHYWTEWSRC